MKNFEINAKTQNEGDTPVAEGCVFSDQTCMVRQYKSKSPWIAFDKGEVFKQVESQVDEDFDYIHLVWVNCR